MTLPFPRPHALLLLLTGACVATAIDPGAAAVKNDTW
jgi:hypothetical protein